MPTSLRGVVKLYDLFPIISPERCHKVYNTLKLPQWSCEKEHYTVCQLKYQKAFLALITQLTDELIFI